LVLIKGAASQHQSSFLVALWEVVSNNHVNKARFHLLFVTVVKSRGNYPG